MTSFAAGFEAVLARIEAAGVAALHEAAEFIGGAADAQTPKDTGALVESRQIEVDDNHAVISYNTPYAHRQHEDLTYNHPNGGNAKYLENPMRSDAEVVIEILARSIGRAL